MPNLDEGKTGKAIGLPFGLALLRGLPLPRKLGLLERIYGGSLAARAIAWVSTANGVLWKLDLRDSSERWIVYGDYEGSVQMDWVRGWLVKGGIVVDSGANIGQMCLYFGPLGAEVHAFEPLPEAADWLEECLGNYPDWKVSLIRSGLSLRKQKIEVQVAGAKSTARMDWYKGKQLRKLDISVISLDDYLEESRIDSVRLWKLDVEGHEPDALEGARKALSNRKIDAVLVEISDDRVASVLKEFGYTINRIEKAGLVPDDDPHARGNRVALPSL